MKKIFLLFLPIVLWTNIQAQDTPTTDTVIAPKVLEAFSKKYQKAEISEWIIEQDNYIITFYKDNKWYDVTMTRKAEWIETFIIIDYEDLPELVRSNFESSKYNDFELNRILQLDNPRNKQFKLLVVNYQDDEIELIFDDQGEMQIKK